VHADCPVDFCDGGTSLTSRFGGSTKEFFDDDDVSAIWQLRFPLCCAHSYDLCTTVFLSCICWFAKRDFWSKKFEQKSILTSCT